MFQRRFRTTPFRLNGSTPDSGRLGIEMHREGVDEREKHTGRFESRWEHSAFAIPLRQGFGGTGGFGETGRKIWGPFPLEIAHHELIFPPDKHAGPLPVLE